MIRPARALVCLLIVCTAILPRPAEAGHEEFESASAAQQPPPLRVVSSGPTGEIADIAQANEVRVVFSEPMVTLGRIPEPVTAPFFQITPAVRGTFRWSGTTILIFTPERRNHCRSRRHSR